MKSLLWELFKLAPLCGLLFMAEANSALPPLKAKCATPRGFHHFVIDKSNVKIIKANREDQRLPASTVLAGTRTRYTQKGFKKFFQLDRKKYYLHIENQNAFSEIDDFVVIKNKKGHEITYPISCHSIK